MSLTQRINDDVKVAMKAKDKDTLKVIRMLKAALQKEQLEQSEPLSAEQELTIITREMKQRKDSLAEFVKANRQDLIDAVQAEIVIVERYLPQQLSPEEVATAVQAIIDELQATKADFGAVMSKAMTQLKGQADGQLVNQTVKSLLK